MEKLPIAIDARRNFAVSSGEPLVFHCHHYNTFLQRTITDARGLDTAPLLTDAASSVLRSQLEAYLRENPELDPRRRLEIAAEFHRLQGFGLLDLSRCEPWGGEARLSHSHYGQGFRSKFGVQKGCVCFFAGGVIEAAMEVAYSRPKGSFRAVERRCIGKGDPACVFEVVPGDPRPLHSSPGVGVISEPLPPARSVATSIDEDAIVSAVGGIPFDGNEEGAIPAFGVYLTRHFANYYNLISYEFERLLRQKSGEAGGEAAVTLLTEAGHVCAFHTFGGIMKSAEWYGLIAPMIKTQADWVHGMIAVVNAFGWGVWRVAELTPNERLVLRIYDSYESNGYCKLYERSEAPRCYLATGGAAGLMNLLYHGDITQKPELSADYYRSLFRSEGSFRATETMCRAKGDPHCEFVASRD